MKTVFRLENPGKSCILLFVERFLHRELIILKEFLPMKIRKVFLLILNSLAILFLSACASIRELPVEKSNPQGGRTADYQLCRELLTAFLKNDGKKFVELLPETTRRAQTAKAYLDSH